MQRLFTMVFLQNLLRIALQEYGKLEDDDNHSNNYMNLHRVFIEVSQKLDKEINKRAA